MPSATKDVITIRVPRQLRAEVRTIAHREGETQNTVYRRLLRRGLETETRVETTTSEGKP
jgi:hypothetical protein